MEQRQPHFITVAETQAANFALQSQIIEQPVVKKRRNRKRTLVDNPQFIPAGVLKNLPDGITFLSKADLSNQVVIELQPEGEDYQPQLEEFGNQKQEVVRIGQFLVNIDIVSKQSLKSMRTYWPANQYRTIKNRKSARLCRNKKKTDLINIDSERTQLLVENSRLKKYIDELERQYVHPTQRMGQSLSQFDQSVQRNSINFNMTTTQESSSGQNRSNNEVQQMNIPLQQHQQQKSEQESLQLVQTSIRDLPQVQNQANINSFLGQQLARQNLLEVASTLTNTSSLTANQRMNEPTKSEAQQLHVPSNLDEIFKDQDPSKRFKSTLQLMGQLNELFPNSYQEGSINKKAPSFVSAPSGINELPNSEGMFNFMKNKVNSAGLFSTQPQNQANAFAMMQKSRPSDVSKNSESFCVGILPTPETFAQNRGNIILPTMFNPPVMRPN